MDKRKKVEAPRDNQEHMNTSVNTTLSNKGLIYITGEELLNEESKINLIKEWDDLISKYTDKRYGVHLIITRL